MKHCMLFKRWYWKRLWKAIKGERYIDVDYFSRSFDDHLATILPQVYDIVNEKLCLNKNIVAAAPKMREDCELFLECMYDWEKNGDAKDKWEDVCLFIKKYGRYLWW